MTALLSRFLTAFVLMIWGTVFTWFYFSGKVQSYLHPSFQVYTAISGILLVLMASVVMIFGFPECCNEDNCVHTHGKFTIGRVFAIIILIVPLFVAISISPGHFSATTVMNRGYIEDVSQLPGAQKFAAMQASAEPLLPGENPANAPAAAEQSADSYLKKNDKGQIVIQTMDLLYAAEEPSMRKDFGGKAVEVTGQFMPAKTKNLSGKRFNLVSMYVMCCAADARPLAVPVEAQKVESFPDMTWLKVVGIATFQRQGEKYTPVIIAESIEPTDAPVEKFLY